MKDKILEEINIENIIKNIRSDVKKSLIRRILTNRWRAGIREESNYIYIDGTEYASYVASQLPKYDKYSDIKNITTWHYGFDKDYSYVVVRKKTSNGFVNGFKINDEDEAVVNTLIDLDAEIIMLITVLECETAKFIGDMFIKSQYEEVDRRNEHLIQKISCWKYR